MKIEKLSGTDAFIAIDLPDAPCAAGVVRAAPKILQGGAKAMARTTTYTFAVRGLQVGGASAGISAEPDALDDAVTAFVAAVAPRVAEGRFVFDAGKGIESESLAELLDTDARPAVHREQVDGRTLDDHLVGVGAVAAAIAALAPSGDWTASVEPGPDAATTLAALAAAGVTDVATTLDADVDVLFSGTRQGAIDTETAALVQAKIVVPIGPHALTAKALAVLRSREIVALPDFVTLAGPSYAGWPVDPDDESTVDSIVTACREGITSLVLEVLDHEEGPFLGACYKAEEFLATWQDELPFGRPLA